MKFIYAFLVIISLSFISCSNSSKEVANDQKLRHVVLFKFKDQIPKDSIVIIEKVFADLPNKIKQIKAFEWGTNNSPEGLDKGFTHSFILTFDSEKAREIYLPHPDHKAFIEIVGPAIEDVLVIDYWAK